ncbi:MAG: IclR family transcriptional regulator [Burkholderiaceae bacterium]|nr:IclR family transcriptional regulator [Burkholderiaceae bacterium]
MLVQTESARLIDRPDGTAGEADVPDRERAGIQSVEVGFALLEVLARADGPLMLRDLAAAAEMSAAKAHRYLVSFQRLELVVQDAATTRYDLGPAALRLGLATLSRLDAVKMGRERLPALLAQVGHTLALAVWGNHGPTLVHWLESPLAMPVNLRLGDVMPLLTSATGRCFAAWLTDESTPGRVDAMIRDELRRLQRRPSTSLRTDAPVSAGDVQAMLAEVRRRGMARVVDTLLPGIVGFCAPVFDSDDRMVMGIVALGSAATLDANWGGAVEVPLRQVATQLSRDLGHRGA